MPDNKTSFLCRLGFHRWIYVTAATAPWWAISDHCSSVLPVFRGCLRCRKEQINQPSFIDIIGHNTRKLLCTATWKNITIQDILKIYYTEDEIYKFNHSIAYLSSKQAQIETVKFYLDALIKKN